MNTRKFVDIELRRFSVLVQQLEERLTALEYAVEGKHASAVATRNAAAAALRERKLRPTLRPVEAGLFITRITDADKIEAGCAELRHRTRTLEANGKLF